MVKERRNVLLATSNGAGLGHVTRQMAIARRLVATGLRPIIVTQSTSLRVVQDMGFPVEYVPSLNASRLSRSEWTRLIYRRYSALVEAYGPRAFVYDGVVPYSGLVDALREHRELLKIWCRRGLWRAGRGRQWLARSTEFDVVVEPGDIADDIDDGVTRSQIDRICRVAPITLLDQHEVLELEDARRALGLEADGTYGLVNLGAGNINETASDTTAIIEALRSSGVTPCLVKSPLSRRPLAIDGVHVVSTFPLARYLRAFDCVVGAAGYNSVHELIVAGVPSVLLPNHSTGLDDQWLRASVMDRRGFALCVDDPTRLSDAVGLIADRGFRRLLARRLMFAQAANGAQEVAELIAPELTAMDRP